MNGLQNGLQWLAENFERCQRWTVRRYGQNADEIFSEVLVEKCSQIFDSYDGVTGTLDGFMFDRFKRYAKKYTMRYYREPSDINQNGGERGFKHTSLESLTESGLEVLDRVDTATETMLEDDRRVDKLLAGVHPYWAWLLRKKFIDGLLNREIAEIVGLTPNAIDKQIPKAIRECRNVARSL